MNRKEIKELDSEIVSVQNSTRTTFPIFMRLHDKLRMRFQWYYRWHLQKYTNYYHDAVLVIYIVIFILAIVNIFY